ncbi:MAG: 2-oxo acid dehydrogenase subunit E2 [Deltaproteobacteria bacterium]|nr:2-oxo acid dehydrogenase subunit E2 [Deltaproteobacteria bacterium]
MFQRNVECRPLKNPSTWRRISLATWEKPGDPSVYGVMEIDMTKAIPLLAELSKKTGQKITVTHLLIKAVAMTLNKYPELNVLIRRGKIYLRDHVDVFVQVFWEENGKADLSGAKVRNAHEKSLAMIAQELVDQAGKIRKGDDPNLKQSKKSLNFLPSAILSRVMKILSYIGYDLNITPRLLKLPPDPFGAVMITNVGMFGIKKGWAPLVPFSRTPLVLAIGEITKTPVAVDDKVVVKPILHIGGTIDHRIIDGYLAGKTSKYLQDLLENPEKML